MNENLEHLLNKALNPRSDKDQEIFFLNLYDHLIPQIYLFVISRNKLEALNDWEKIVDSDCCELFKKLMNIPLSQYPKTSDQDILQFALKGVMEMQIMR